MKLFLALVAIMVVAVSARSGSCAHRRVELRRRLLHLHKRAARCGDEDSACISNVFAKIARVRRHMARARRHVCSGGSLHISTRDCHQSFSEYLAARRARINRIARRCGDEDDSCVTTSMELLMALNKDHARQRRLWRQSCHFDSSAVSHHGHISAAAIARERARQHMHMPEEKWVPMKVWTHEFVCSRIRSGFKRWLKSQERRREMFHRDSAKCHQSDLACLHMNFQSIIHIQRAIHRARNLYSKRMASCDVCAPVKIKWTRWMHRQRLRRHRLQLEACRCDENDPTCMDEKVKEIKRIQHHMRERRRRAFQLHGECLTREDHKTRHLATPLPAHETEIPDL